MNRLLQKIHHLFGHNITKNSKADTLKSKIMEERQKDIQGLKKTNGIIKVMIEKGELEFKIVKK